VSAVENQFPGHQWFLVPWIPLTDKEVGDFEKGVRKVFKKLDPFDPPQVPAAAIYCGRCKRQLADLGWGERDVCRGDEEAELGV
jgi:hypothetical protein